MQNNSRGRHYYVAICAIVVVSACSPAGTLESLGDCTAPPYAVANCGGALNNDGSATAQSESEYSYFEAYSPFQKAVVEDLLGPVRASKAARPSQIRYLPLDRPLFLTTIVLSHGRVSGNGVTNERGEVVMVQGVSGRPRPGYSDGITLDGEAIRTRYGGESLSSQQQEMLADAIAKNNIYKPLTFVSRLTNNDEGGDPATNRCPERIAWYAWVHPDMAYPLTALAHGSVEANDIKVFSTADWLVAHPESQGASVRMTASSSLGRQEVMHLGELVWWRVGRYIGIAPGMDPRTVLLLLPGTKFTYRELMVNVKTVNDDTYVVEVDVSYRRNPFAKED